MENMKDIVTDILKAISDLKKSGIIEEIGTRAASDQQGTTNCRSLPEKVDTPGDGEASDT